VVDQPEISQRPPTPSLRAGIHVLAPGLRTDRLSLSRSQSGASRKRRLLPQDAQTSERINEATVKCTFAGRRPALSILLIIIIVIIVLAILGFFGRGRMGR
jgi:hypothetical protein